ncbi:MAG: MarR family winged helix-turn-helix transcriptional regulator [Parvibaculaceae bacterium]
MAEETRIDKVLQVWVRLIRARDRIVRNVEAAAKAKGFPPIAWYDVLLELSREGGRRLRPVELEKELLVAQYNLSRLLDRMEEAGLIERAACPGDGRGQMISLTAQGRAMQKRMWPALREAVEEHVAPNLSERELGLLVRLLGAIGGSLRPEAGGDSAGCDAA